jgi:Ner family transcriptional regulator
MDASKTVLLLRQTLRELGFSEAQSEWHLVKFICDLNQISMRDIARNNHISPYSLAQVAYRPIPRYQEAIAKALNISPAELWPSRYRLPLVGPLSTSKNTEEVSP